MAAATDGDSNSNNKSSKGKVTYLHGDLDLKIIAARRLPNMDAIASGFRRCFAVCDAKPAVKSRSLDSASDDDEKKLRKKIMTTDAYVTVVVPQATVARTRVLKNTQSPHWNEHFVIQLAHPVEDLEFQVKDDDVFGAELIGTAKIPAESIATGKLISDWFPILNAKGQTPKEDTAIRLEMKFTSCEENPVYKCGVGGDPNHGGVRGTYFPLRKGCRLKLYQDAHVMPGQLPAVKMDGHVDYRPGTCWEDICYAISEAHHLVYIVGWSVFHKIKLIREPTRELPRGGDLTLGELLKYKSEEGLRILLLIWDDKTSHDKFGIRTVSFSFFFFNLIILLG